MGLPRSRKFSAKPWRERSREYGTSICFSTLSVGIASRDCSFGQLDGAQSSFTLRCKFASPKALARLVAPPPADDATSSGHVGATSCAANGSSQWHASRIYAKNCGKSHNRTYRTVHGGRNVEFSYSAKWLVFSQFDRWRDGISDRTGQWRRKPGHT